MITRYIAYLFFGFKVVEFDHFRKQAGRPTFTLSVNGWIEATGAIGIKAKSGRYGGTYAHKDIAFEFCGAISPVFKLYLIKEYQRLKAEEANPLLAEWNIKRVLSKVNYDIHPKAILVAFDILYTMSRPVASRASRISRRLLMSLRNQSYLR